MTDRLAPAPQAGHPASPAAAPRKADAAAWLAVAAGALGAMMATLDISIVNSALPTIQGEIGASGSEGTWISTAYLVAEIVIIPLSGWLERLFGLRTFLLLAVSLFVGFSMLCGFSDSLGMMIAGRIGQGFTGGALIPTAMTIIAVRLPREQQPIGGAMFGAVVITGPLLGPVLGGWLTENLSWHYAFFLNLPIGILLISLLTIGMPHKRADWRQLRGADWLGIAGLTLGLGGLTIVLEEGQREQWFASTEICVLTVVSIVGFGLLFAGQVRAAAPVIRLRLLLDPQFAAIIAMITMVGVVMYGTSYVIPQFLSIIAGYNAMQAGKVMLVAGLPIIVILPFTPFLIRNVDSRVAVGTGMLLIAISAWYETDLTTASSGASFTLSQVLRGSGMIIASNFMNQAAIRSMPPSLASDAAGLYNAARNLGGSLALAGVGLIQDNRIWLHMRRIEEGLSANDPAVQAYMQAQAQMPGGSAAAYRTLSGTIQAQATTMAFADIFWLLAIGSLAVAPLVLLMRPIRGPAPAGLSH